MGITPWEGGEIKGPEFDQTMLPQAHIAISNTELELIVTPRILEILLLV